MMYNSSCCLGSVLCYVQTLNVFSKYTLLFLVNCLNKSINGCGFGYGMGLTGTRSDTRTFMLPVDKKGNPDYVFMERYIRNLIKHKRDEYRRFLNKQTNKQEWLPSKKWEKFKIKDITLNGKISTGAYVSKAKLHSGTTPRITVTSVNNGVDGFYSCTDKNYRCHNNFISVSFLGDCFYHGYLASLDMKVHSLQFKDYKLTPCVALFMVACLKNNTKVHSYGNQLSSTDLPMKNILLPKNEVTGLPDYEFMEKYVMNIVLRKYTSYLDFILRN